MVMLFTFSACGGGGDDDPVIEPTQKEDPQKPSGGESGTFQLSTTCSTCLGSKNCVDCKGTGKGCKTCHGTGEYCKECLTSGLCSGCDGTGNCISCNGIGSVKCDLCYGGKVCKYCKGQGYLTNPSFPCNWCHGEKYCTKCGGAGTEECGYCFGLGRCLDCNGTKICQTCHGNPICKTCGGDGHCGTCMNSDGKCKVCNGTGEESLTALTFTERGGDAKIFVHSTSKWNMSADVEWIKPSLMSGNGDYTIIITAEKNPTAMPRTGIVTFTYGNKKVTVNISQTGETPALTAAATSVFIYANGTGETISISSNTSWKVRTNDSWVTCSPSSGHGNGTITVSASPYTNGARYSKFTITDATDSLAVEVSVAQAANPDELTMLKNLLEKPLGIIDVSLKTASYQTIKNAVAKSYQLEEGVYDFSGKPYFYVWNKDNPTLSSITYKGMTLWYMSVYHSPYSRNITYTFEIAKSNVSYDYTGILNDILQDFKYNMNIELEQNTNSTSTLPHYRVTDANGNYYSLSVSENNRTNVFQYEIEAQYK